MGLLMPSCYSTEHSVQDALALAENIGMPHETIAIKAIYEQYLEALHPLFKDQPFNVAEENLQARTRGMLVMAMSNKYGYIPIKVKQLSDTARFTAISAVHWVQSETFLKPISMR